MNFYCLDCGCVWFGVGITTDHCHDCGSTDLASANELMNRFVTEHVMCLPELQVRDPAAAKVALINAIGPCLNLQDMILNGPFAKDD